MLYIQNWPIDLWFIIVEQSEIKGERNEQAPEFQVQLNSSILKRSFLSKYTHNFIPLQSISFHWQESGAVMFTYLLNSSLEISYTLNYQYLDRE